jgi:hypothetical protein
VIGVGVVFLGSRQHERSSESMADRSLRLKRVCSGFYGDLSKRVEIRWVGHDGWQLITDGSWVSTLPTKRACVDAWLDLTDRPRAVGGVTQP